MSRMFNDHRINGKNLSQAVNDIVSRETAIATIKGRKVQQIGKRAAAIIDLLTADTETELTDVNMTLVLDWLLCKNHTGKMQGLISISTNCENNPICIARMKCNESICKHCFAAAQLEQYFAQNVKQCIATYVLSYREYTAFPVVSSAYFHIESFGDLLPGEHGRKQACNYFRFVTANSHCRSAWWTKNPEIIADCMSYYGIEKPENLRIILSDPKVNGSDWKRETIQNTFPFVDSIFSVYSDEKSAENNELQINCGARSCLTCARCYSGSNFYVNELLK